MMRTRLGLRVIPVLIAAALLALSARHAGAAECPGDCNGDGVVTIAEVITVIKMNLGVKPVSACPAGARNGFEADTMDAVCAMRNALYSTCQSC